MVQQRTNFVAQVAMQANISLGNSIGTLTKPGSIADYAHNAAGNFQQIAEIGMHAAAMAENNQSSVTMGGPSGGPSSMKSMIGAAAMIGIGAAVPMAAPAMAAIGAAMAVRDAVNFSIGHAAVNGAQGELTMAAAAAATFDSKGEMTSYTAACDNVTSDVKSGRSLAAVAVGPNAATPLRGQHNLNGIIGQVAGEYDPDQIRKDVRGMLEREQKNYGWAINKLEMLGAIDPNSKHEKDLGVKDTMVAVGLEKPRPKGINMGMGAPSLG